MNMMLVKNLEQQNINAGKAVDKDWWRGAVIYQIYPRSFQDSNGDGIGDLRGITSRLSYISDLGVDAVWISPFFTSPMRDFGYDVADYRGIDKIFGTMQDFEEMMEKAHNLGLKVMIDLVLSHTSDEHSWFKQSRSSKDNEKADWYVWADAKYNNNGEKTVPNNWLSIFGGSAWEWDDVRQQYYMHNFLTSQPDLNLHNKHVQDALLDVARFWMDKGVDGFRLDTINFYFHDQKLRDNPLLAVDKRNSTIAPEINPYNHFDHKYDKNQPENIDFLKRFRKVMDEYPAIAAVGEVGDAQYGMELMSDYTKGDDLMQMCYAFDFLSGDTQSATHVAEILNKFKTMSNDSWSCWAFSNHDVMRHTSRWSLNNAAQKAFSALLLSFQGSVCLYQGEELGLEEATVEFADLQDPYGKEFWPKFKGRDGCRTPMVWNDELPYGGFSSSKTWLPVFEPHLKKSAATQETDKKSMLNYYRSLISFRKQLPILSKGEIDNIKVDNNVLTFTRRLNNQTLLCAFNLSDTSQTITITDNKFQPLGGLGFSYSLCEKTLMLPAWQVFYAHKKTT